MSPTFFHLTLHAPPPPLIQPLSFGSPCFSFLRHFFCASFFLSFFQHSPPPLNSSQRISLFPTPTISLRQTLFHHPTSSIPLLIVQCLIEVVDAPTPRQMTTEGALGPLLFIPPQFPPVDFSDTDLAF